MRLGPVPAGVRPVSDRGPGGSVLQPRARRCADAARARPVRRNGRRRDRGAVAGGRAGGVRRARRARRRPVPTTWNATSGWLDRGRRRRRRTRPAFLRGTLPSRAARSTSCSCDPPYEHRAHRSGRRPGRFWLGMALLTRAWTVVLTAGQQEFHACHSGTLGRREAAPLRRQPRHLVPGGVRWA